MLLATFYELIKSILNPYNYIIHDLYHTRREHPSNPSLILDPYNGVIKLRNGCLGIRKEVFWMERDEKIATTIYIAIVFVLTVGMTAGGHFLL